MRSADGVSVCASGFRIGVHTSCVAASMAIRHGTSCYFRGTTLPGWILNGGRLVPVDAPGPGSVRGGRLFASRTRSCGVRTAFADKGSPLSPCLRLVSLSVSSVFACLPGVPRCVFCLVGSSAWSPCLRRPPAPPAGARVRGLGFRASSCDGRRVFLCVFALLIVPARAMSHGRCTAFRTAVVPLAARHAGWPA